MKLCQATRERGKVGTAPTGPSLGTWRRLSRCCSIWTFSPSSCFLLQTGFYYLTLDFLLSYNSALSWHNADADQTLWSSTSSVPPMIQPPQTLRDASFRHLNKRELGLVQASVPGAVTGGPETHVSRAVERAVALKGKGDSETKTGTSARGLRRIQPRDSGSWATSLCHLSKSIGEIWDGPKPMILLVRRATVFTEPPQRGDIYAIGHLYRVPTVVPVWDCSAGIE